MNDLIIGLLPDFIVILIFCYLLLKSKKSQKKENNKYYILGILVTFVFMVVDIYYHYS